MKIVKAIFQNFETSVLTIFLSLLSFGQLLRFQLTNDIAVYAYDFLIGGYLTWLFLMLFKNQTILKKISGFFKKIIQTRKLELIWLLWLVGGILIGSLVGTVELRGWLYCLRLVAYLVFALSLNQSRKLIYSPRTGVVFIGFLLGLLGALQYLFLPDTRFLNLYGWDNHYYRLIGTFFDPAFTGMMLVLTIGLSIDFKKIKQLPPKIMTVGQLLLVAAIAATFSRASYLALVVMMSLLFLKRLLSGKFLLISAFVFVSTLLLLPKPGGEGVNLARTSTGEARLVNSKYLLNQLQGGQWLWGRGLFNSDAAQNSALPSYAQLPDSLPVLIINGSGLGGLLLSGLVLVKWLKSWWKNDPIWASVFISVFVHSLFNNTLLQPFIFLSLWLSKNQFRQQ